MGRNADESDNSMIVLLDLGVWVDGSSVPRSSILSNAFLDLCRRRVNVMKGNCSHPGPHVTCTAWNSKALRNSLFCTLGHHLQLYLICMTVLGCAFPYYCCIGLISLPLLLQSRTEHGWASISK